MFRLDLGLWAFATTGLASIEADPSLTGFIKNASLVGTVIGAGWILDARTKATVRGAIEDHTKVEEARMDTVKAEFNGAMDTLGAKLDGIDQKLGDMTRRPCQACNGHTPVPR